VQSKKQHKEKSDLSQKEWLLLAESAGGIGSFEWDLASGKMRGSPQAAALLGLEPENADRAFDTWERGIFIDDVPKIRAAFETAQQNGRCDVEFRVRHTDGRVDWIACKGQVAPRPAERPLLRGAFSAITERKALDARLLALNETLDSRVAELREEARTLEVLNQTGVAIAAELDLESLVQIVTDAGVELSHGEFCAFFYKVINESGEAYTLCTLSGAPREAFAQFPMPRNTAVFEPTFRGRGPVRSDDILADARYGKSAPYHGLPEGHLPVRSYLAVPVVSRSGDVLGGLFFGHPEPAVFTERAERIVTALAAQAAVAIDNVRLHQVSQREIAARRQAEQDLQKLNETLEARAEKRAKDLAASQNKLAETEHRFRLLVESVTDYAIYMLDPNGHVINWNPGAERFKGYSRQEILGQHFSIFYTPEEQKEGVPAKALATAALTGKFEAEGWRVRRDGGRFWASVVINAIKGPKGELLGFAKITRDLTERRAADDRAQQAQKMESIGHLTGGVAHDFNNLLTIIIGNLETLQRNLKSPTSEIDQLQRSAENAMRGARRAESLTQRLLAFSRQQPLDPKPTDLGRLVSGMSDLMRRTLGEQVTVETVRGGGLWPAFADPHQLEIAILNLAVNARDAMPNGGKLTLETANVNLDENYAANQAEVVPGQYVMLAVSDTGGGMSAEVRARAFEPFFTTKDVGHGTGLGLSQVYGFVKQSRGNVKIYSEVGVGTTVKLYLPRSHADNILAEDEADHPLALGSSKDTILVVEDDPDVRAYSSETLRELGYTVLEAATGVRALELLKANPEVRVIFSDVGLPGGMNGGQLADQARAHWPNVKVLFTSGYARNAIVHGGRLDPGVELITKPFTQAALAEKLRNILDSSRNPGRVLLVEDEPLIQMLVTDYLASVGFTVDIAGTATDALNKLGLIPGGMDAAVVDVGLPDRTGDWLVREMRARYPSLPIVLATGRSTIELRKQFEGEQRLAFVSKPYTQTELLSSLRKLGIAISSAPPRR
jgi:PAS domain S-box-containing protein